MKTFKKLITMCMLGSLMFQSAGVTSYAAEQTVRLQQARVRKIRMTQIRQHHPACPTATFL